MTELTSSVALRKGIKYTKTELYPQRCVGWGGVGSSFYVIFYYQACICILDEILRFGCDKNACKILGTFTN
jgi:hypothetical protein